VARSTRDLILAAAVELMRTQGLARTTTKEIARAAGYSEATLYKHFRDKDELFLAALREQMPATVGVFARLPEWPGQSTVRAHLEEIVVAMVPFLELSVPIGGSLFSQPTLLEKHQQLQRAAGTGPQRAIQEEAAAQLLLGACFQRAYIGSFMGPDFTPQPLEQFARDVVRTLLRGIEPAG
jgi:AcrR family transcriptional regulator